MSKLWQVYYNAIFGAIGGLGAWLLIGLIPATTWNFIPTADWDIHIENAAIGLGIGLLIGAAIGAVEGVLIKRSFLPTITGMFGGGLAGGLSGMLGLFLGGITFVILQGGLIARMLGWMALGLFLGVGQGAISLQLKRASYGLVGGTLAGLVGGIFYEVLTQAFIKQSGEAQVILSALGLALIGGSLGGIIPFSVEILRRAAGDGLVVVLNGRRANVEKEVLGSLTLGSSDACGVYLPDPGIEKQQAVISKTPNGFVIRNIGQTQSLTAGIARVIPGSTAILNNNDIIQMSETKLRFRSR